MKVNMGLENNNIENTAAEIWGIVKEQLAERIPRAAMLVWFDDANCEPIDVDKHSLVLCVNSEFAKNVIEAKFSPIIVDIMNVIFSCDDAELIILAKDHNFIY